MAAVTSFAVPTRQDPQANIAGIVSISRAHPDAVPESLLSIAAQQSSAGEVVRLSSWAEPNVAVLQYLTGDCPVILVCRYRFGHIRCSERVDLRRHCLHDLGGG